MKVIDLLNKIANGEEVPKKIIIGYDALIYNEEHNLFLQDYYYMKDEENATWKIWAYRLDDEVEILEEEPKDIEVCGSLFTKSEYDKLAHSEEEKKIPEQLIPTSLKGIDNLDEKIEIAHIDTVSAINKINEVIDYLKSKGE